MLKTFVKHSESVSRGFIEDGAAEKVFVVELRRRWLDGGLVLLRDALKLNDACLCERFCCSRVHQLDVCTACTADVPSNRRLLLLHIVPLVRVEALVHVVHVARYSAEAERDVHFHRFNKGFAIAAVAKELLFTLDQHWK